MKEFLSRNLICQKSLLLVCFFLLLALYGTALSQTVTITTQVLIDLEEEDFRKINNADVVIFIGDYDGSDTVLKIAETGKMFYWLCTESRYENVSDHSWCNYDDDEIRKIFRMETFKIANCNRIGEPEYDEKLWLRAIDKLMQ